MHDNEVRASNARTLAQAVTAVATEIARTGIEVAMLGADTYSAGIYGGTHGAVTVKIHATSPSDVVTLAALFPGLPAEPSHYYGGKTVAHRGEWTGMGLSVEVYGPAAEQVTA